MSSQLRIVKDSKSDTLQSGTPVKLEGVPVYASNTAALAGGLSVGDVYRIAASPGAASMLAIVY